MRERPGSFRAALASLSLAALAAPVPVAARPAPRISLPNGTLAGALAAIAARGGVEIVSLEPGLNAVPVRATAVPDDPAKALTRVLRGTGFVAVRVGDRAWRIERGPVPAAARRAPSRRLPRDEPAADAPITVMAGKFPTRLIDYPGALVRLPALGGPALPPLTRIDRIAAQTAVVSSTAFGDGRDKLFIRGIADSSFNGAAQPTTAIYFDDAPIGFGSPNVNLRLHDVASVEVLEGPQGTLYGGGSMGGVIRITPNPVELGRVGGGVTAGLAHTAGGAPGWDLAATVNLPVLDQRAGVRLVGYAEHDGGYLDDPRFGDRINAVAVRGARAAAALAPGGGITLDIGALYQLTSARDAQYVDGAVPLARTAELRQPYGNELVLGRASVRKEWNSGLELAGVVSYGHRSSFDRFDAAQSAFSAAPAAYDLQRSTSAWVVETRLSRPSASGLGWVAGLSLQRLSDGQSRALGLEGEAAVLDEVTNITRSASLFGQARLPLGRSVQATVGVRYTVARTDSEPARGRMITAIRGDGTEHFDPTLALLWKIAPAVSAFGRFQTGYRNGGVTVARGIGRVSEFRPDTITMGEVGVKARPLGGDTALELGASVSYAQWTDVIAELVTRRGTPVTSNVGNARLLAVEGTVSLALASGWRVKGQALWTDNRLTGELPSQTASRDRRLPDTPAFTGRLDAGYEWTRGNGVHRIGAGVRYVGRSVLGPGTLLNLSQGDYALADLTGAVSRGGLQVQLSVENALNTRGNRFALGNPLQLQRREQFVPLVPRTVRLSLVMAR